MIIHKKSNDKLTQGVRHIVAATIYFLTQDVVAVDNFKLRQLRQTIFDFAFFVPQFSYIIILWLKN